MLFGFIGPTEVIVILVIALLVFGPQKLPEIGRQIGSAYREMNKMRGEVTRALEFESYAQPYDAPPYESPASGQTYAHGSYDYNYDSEYDATDPAQLPPPGPRLEQSNVTLLSESEMSGPYTPYAVADADDAATPAAPATVGGDESPATSGAAETGSRSGSEGETAAKASA
jgi:TatA/E family protein of Tat protein translocase